MNKNLGFATIEFFIALVIVMIICTTCFNIYTGAQIGFSNVSMGINGMTESRCIDGFKFTIDQRGFTRQIMDELGHGVKCTTEK